VLASLVKPPEAHQQMSVRQRGPWLAAEHHLKAVVWDGASSHRSEIAPGVGFTLVQ
jgi:hypothetical protein